MLQKIITALCRLQIETHKRIEAATMGIPCDGSLIHRSKIRTINREFNAESRRIRACLILHELGGTYDDVLHMLEEFDINDDPTGRIDTILANHEDLS